MENKLFNLKNKVAVVTGGAGHLGAAICEGLAEAGATVVIASRDIVKCRELAEKLSEQYQIEAIGMKVDISSKDSVEELMATVSKIKGHIDIFVNNAFFGASGGIMDITEDNWLKGIDGTINSAFRCLQAVIPYMVKQQKGKIINISSMYGLVSPDPRIYSHPSLSNPPNYGAGKAAIIQLTKYAACHLAKDNIMVNAITPGAFPNPEVQKNKQFIDNLENKIPLGRIGRPEDLKGAVLFLASDASDYVTGANIVVDGGWTVW